jgi:hypothetical protein
MANKHDFQEQKMCQRQKIMFFNEKFQKQWIK